MGKSAILRAREVGNLPKKEVLFMPLPHVAQQILSSLPSDEGKRELVIQVYLAMIKHRLAGRKLQEEHGLSLSDIGALARKISDLDTPYGGDRVLTLLESELQKFHPEAA